MGLGRLSNIKRGNRLSFKHCFQIFFINMLSFSAAAGIFHARIVGTSFTYVTNTHLISLDRNWPKLSDHSKKYHSAISFNIDFSLFNYMHWVEKNSFQTGGNTCCLSHFMYNWAPSSKAIFVWRICSLKIHPASSLASLAFLTRSKNREEQWDILVLPLL